MKGYDIHEHKKILKGDVSENASKKERNNSSGVHISFKEAIIKLLDEDIELTAKKIMIKIIKNKEKLKLLMHLMPTLDKVNENKKL